MRCQTNTGGWNPNTVSCVFTPSDSDEDVVSAPTAIVDGVIDGSRILTCTIPPITAGATANVTFEWFGGTPVSLFSRGVGTNTLYSASWFTGMTLVKGQREPPRFRLFGVDVAHAKMVFARRLTALMLDWIK